MVHKPIHGILVGFCLLLFISTATLGVLHLKQRSVIAAYEREKTQNRFELLSPTVAWLSVNEFLAQQQSLSTNLGNVRPRIESIIENDTASYGVYVEDLTTGAWIGINEREDFIPASLLKIPVLVAVLKKVELGEISLNQTVRLHEDDLDFRFGTLAYFGAGYEISVRDLLTTLIRDSDNTAVLTFGRYFITDGEFEQAALAIGLPPLYSEQGVSPKEYSNALRSLYYSTYMRRVFSELAISILMKTSFPSQLPAKLPPDLRIAHKIGVAYDDDSKVIGSFHDCGIVYLPGKPYSICVMSRGVTRAEADATISTISLVVYEYMAAQVLPPDTAN